LRDKWNTHQEEGPPAARAARAHRLFWFFPAVPTRATHASHPLRRLRRPAQRFFTFPAYTTWPKTVSPEAAVPSVCIGKVVAKLPAVPSMLM
jgi:hypothetical protein